MIPSPDLPRLLAALSAALTDEPLQFTHGETLGDDLLEDRQLRCGILQTRKGAGMPSAQLPLRTAF